jgi:hypothetical protein
MHLSFDNEWRGSQGIYFGVDPSSGFFINNAVDF